MRDIVHVQVGNCGNMISHDYWKRLVEEHRIDRNGCMLAIKEDLKKKVDVFFSEDSKGNYHPRALCTDLDPSTWENIAESSLKNLYDKDSIVVYPSSSGAGNNWAKGMFTEGPEIIEDLVEAFRLQIEICDSLQGVVLPHGASSGTGGGFTSLFLNHLTMEFPSTPIQLFSVYSTRKTGGCQTRAYNEVLTLQQMMEANSHSHTIEEDALYNYIVKSKSNFMLHGTYGNFDKILGHMMSNVTSVYRDYGTNNSTMQRMFSSLCPFPRMRLYTTSHAPLDTSVYCRGMSGRGLGFEALQRDALSEMHQLVDASRGEYRMDVDGSFTCSDFSREGGNRATASRPSITWASTSIYRSCLYDIFDIDPSISNPSMHHTIDRSIHDDTAYTYIRNTTDIKHHMMSMADQFTRMFRRKAFLHHYTTEGMENEDFEEAYEYFINLIREYDSGEGCEAWEDDSSFGGGDHEHLAPCLEVEGWVEEWVYEI